MDKLWRAAKTKSIGFLITASCVAVVFLLVASIVAATYASFSSSTREAVGAQTRELSTQIIYNYESYIDSMIATSNIIQTDIDSYDTATDEGAAAFSRYLADIVHINSDIITISIYSNDGTRCLFSSQIDNTGKPQDVTKSQWFTEAVSDPTVHAFSVPYSEKGTGEYRINISKQFKYRGADGRCVLKMELSFERFIDLVKKSNLGVGGHVTIIDPDYNIVYSTLDADAKEELSTVRSIILGSSDARMDGHDMSVNVDTLSGTRWRICVFINIDNVTGIERNFFATTMLVSMGVLTLGIMLFLYISKKITDPIQQLELAMRRVEERDYFRTQEVSISATAEVESLALRFNKMMQKISELMQRVIDEQNAQRKSELKALQNQINPHFLYNTLDSIVWLVEQNKNDAAREMVVALARLFRISISKGQEVIPVRSELEHVRNYLLIQSIRYSDSFDYVFDVDENVLECMTMKLILQPIVENCIYHGLKNRIDKGHIRISAKREDGFIVFTVCDNGYGMKQETIDALYESFRDGAPSEGVGLKNIYTRIRMYYNNAAQMIIESELDEGTSITVKEPVEKS
ncbi:MAG: sensor histidine kinase [Oscillospiraceae bacterium]|nr:sensor histidine kinase [Oscillospiraceae bacterium]